MKQIFCIFLIFVQAFSVSAIELQKITDIKDFSHVDFFNNEEVTLDSGWQFYWNQLLEPNDFIEENSALTVTTGSWTDFSILTKEQLPSFGHATYRFTATLPKDIPYMALHIPAAYSSSKVWINGELRSSIGKVATTSDDVIHKNLSQTIPFTSHDRHLEIIIQIANYYHQNGGLLKSPILGSNELLSRQENIKIIVDMLFIGSTGFFGFSSLFLFLFFWRKDRAILYFALFCLCWSYRTLSDNYAPISFILPDNNTVWLFLVKIEYIALFSGGFAASAFLSKIFSRHVHRIYVKILIYSFYTFTTITILLPSIHSTKLLVPFFALMAVNIGYVLFIIIKASLTKQRESPLALICILLSALVLSSHIFSFFGNSSQGLIYINMGYVLVFMLTSMLLGMRFSRSFFTLESLQNKTFEQKEEILSQSDQLSEVNKQLNERSTELKLRNDEISKMNMDLEEKILHRTVRLQSANKELDTFLYRSSHDLMRPIKTIEGLAYLSELSNTQAEYLELFKKIKESTFDMNRLLKRLSKVHEIENHKLNPESINMDIFFDNLKKEIIGTVKSKNKLSFELNYPKTISKDQLTLHYLLAELFKNSAIWADHVEGGILIKCTVSIKEKSGIEIQLSDNGPGIPKEFKPQVFEMYKVANEHTQTHGLGLFIVQKISEKHAGHVRLTSEEGQGTEVTIVLP